MAIQGNNSKAPLTTAFLASALLRFICSNTTKHVFVFWAANESEKLIPLANCSQNKYSSYSYVDVSHTSGMVPRCGKELFINRPPRVAASEQL